MPVVAGGLLLFKNRYLREKIKSTRLHSFSQQVLKKINNYPKLFYALRVIQEAVIPFSLYMLWKTDGTIKSHQESIKKLEEKINSLNREILDIKNTNSSLSHENELLKNPVVHDCEFYNKAKNDLMGLSDELEKLKHDIKIKTNEIQWLTS